MSGKRSPGYPNFSLREAVKRAEKIFSADRRNPVERENAAKHMGYNGLNGAADKALATMVHYGLLERVGKGEVRISQLAVDILHPDSPAQRKEALHASAYRPLLFATLRERFPDGASAETLKSYLVRENFLDRAISPAISAYGDTCAYTKQEGAFDSGGPDESEGEESSPDEFEDAPMDTATDTLKKPPPLPPLPPTPAAFEVATGMRKFVINLPNGGDAILAYPGNLTAEGYQDLEDYLTLFLKKAKRGSPVAKAADEDIKDVLR